jgi:hypothetical protein
VLGDLIHSNSNRHLPEPGPDPDPEHVLDLALDGLRAFDLGELRRDGVGVGADADFGFL